MTDGIYPAWSAFAPMSGSIGRWLSVEVVHWPGKNYWTSPLVVNNVRRIRTIAALANDRAAQRRLKRYWKRMVREGKMK